MGDADIKKALQEALKAFERSGKTSEELNALRNKIFDAKNDGFITVAAKDKLIKDLYLTATLKGIFFMKVIDKLPGLPKTEEEAEALAEEEEESYEEESYEESYDEDEEEDEEEEEASGAVVKP